MTADQDLRVSDADRDRAAAEVREHFAAGRLSEEELNERVDTVYRARTKGDLDRARADLPALPASPAEARAELAERRSQLRRELLQQTGGALVPFFICVAIWAMSGANGSFWPAWVAIGAVVLLVRNGWRLFGPAPELDQVEADLARRREHRQERYEHRHEHRQRRRLER